VTERVSDLQVARSAHRLQVPRVIPRDRSTVGVVHRVHYPRAHPGQRQRAPPRGTDRRGQGVVRQHSGSDTPPPPCAPACPWPTTHATSISGGTLRLATLDLHRPGRRVRLASIVRVALEPATVRPGEPTRAPLGSRARHTRRLKWSPAPTVPRPLTVQPSHNPEPPPRSRGARIDATSTRGSSPRRTPTMTGRQVRQHSATVIHPSRSSRTQPQS
jgi:hypothetical protein